MKIIVDLRPVNPAIDTILEKHVPEIDAMERQLVLTKRLGRKVPPKTFTLKEGKETVLESILQYLKGTEIFDEDTVYDLVGENSYYNTLSLDILVDSMAQSLVHNTTIHTELLEIVVLRYLELILEQSRRTLVDMGLAGPFIVKDFDTIGMLLVEV